MPNIRDLIKGLWLSSLVWDDTGKVCVYIYICIYIYTHIAEDFLEQSVASTSKKLPSLACKRGAIYVNLSAKHVT